MSIYSRVKCSPEELNEWKKEVLKYLKNNGVDVSKIKILFQKNYDGNCKIYTYKQTFENDRYSVRKSDESSTGYMRSKFCKDVWMGVYFYRAEWRDYLGKGKYNKLTRENDLEDIKKIYATS